MNSPVNRYKLRVRKTKDAIWRKAFPKQASALRPAKVVKPPKARKPIRPQSKRNAPRRATYSKVKGAFMARLAGARCPVAQVLWGTVLPIEDLHHARGRTGTLLYDSRYFIGISRKAHDWVHMHPLTAQAILIKHQLRDDVVRLYSGPGEQNQPDPSYDDATNSYLLQ